MLKEINNMITINYFSQDPLVQAPSLNKIPKKLISDGPENEREIVDDWANPKAKADSSGNYIYPVEDPRFDQVESIIASTKALNFFQKYTSREIPWGNNTKQITIMPHYGEMANAYYDVRFGMLCLGYFKDPVRGKTVQTSQSQDIVAHETGHAIINSIRPNYNEGFSIGCLGVHESIADITAIITALSDENLIRQVLKDVGGNINQSNPIETIAEELAIGIKNKYADQFRPDQDLARHAVNNFVYKEQKELPFLDRKNDDKILGTEHHSYSRLFTGTFYDILASIYNKNKEKELNQEEALANARDVSASLVLKALEYAPWGDISFKELAAAMVKTDILDYNGNCQKFLKEIFTKRNILSEDEFNKVLEDAKNIPSFNLPDDPTAGKITELVGKNKELLGINPETKLVFKNIYRNEKEQKFINFETKKTIQLEGPDFEVLEGMSLDIKGGLTLVFGKDGKLTAETIDDITPSEIENIKDNIARLVKAGLIGMGPFFTNDENKIESYLSPNDNPYIGITTISKGGRVKLVRSPIIS